MMQKRLQASTTEERTSAMDKEASLNSSSLISDGKSGLKPFILTRSAQQKSVFGLGYPSIPTMTVDEWYNQRFGSTSVPSQKEQKTYHESNAEDGCSSESDHEENDEQARAKSIMWDEYKDYHRRGWGNTHNKDSDSGSDHDGEDLPSTTNETRDEDNGPVTKRAALLWSDALIEQNLLQKGSGIAIEKPGETQIQRGVESYHVRKTFVRSEDKKLASLDESVHCEEASASAGHPFDDSVIDLSAETAFCERVPDDNYCSSSRTIANKVLNRGGSHGSRGRDRGPFNNGQRGKHDDRGLKRYREGKVADRNRLLIPSYSLETLMAVEFASDISVEQLGKDMAKALGEINPSTIHRIVNACGVDKAISLFEETRKIESTGGMMTDNRQRRRTPGGVFIMLFKLDSDIPEHIKAKVFGENKEEGRRMLKARRKGRPNFAENVAKLGELMRKEREKESSVESLKPLPPATEILLPQDLTLSEGSRVSDDVKTEDIEMDL
ncbi:hypothetical protein KIN20_023749 [Parelaphostrongylus tenuis]|uniref:Phosphorylated adapter RNA export protein n=1 Tax=Parelaphostrongylus tenuis TaxID=148309 RepID=A0AAD5QXG9_PARTN|nr:hypothetical protein KIN20_023749 [Parelaphostrongylus tenuis]